MIGFDENGHFLHDCHCGAWGSRGVGVRLFKGRLGSWYCAAHIADAKPEEIDVSDTPHTAIPIPTRFRSVCEFCNSDLDTRAAGVHQWTAGWVMQRAGGGGHGISLPERSNRWAHRYCVENAIRGTTQQASLL